MGIGWKEGEEGTGKEREVGEVGRREEEVGGGGGREEKGDGRWEERRREGEKKKRDRERHGLGRRREVEGKKHGPFRACLDIREVNLGFSQADIFTEGRSLSHFYQRGRGRGGEGGQKGSSSHPSPLPPHFCQRGTFFQENVKRFGGGQSLRA